jgi:hypothetical protein
MGVGSGVACNLLRDMSRKTSGRFEYIINSEDITNSVIALLDESLNPFLNDFQISSTCGKLMQIKPNNILKDSITDFYFYDDNYNNQDCSLSLIIQNPNHETKEFIFYSRDASQLIDTKHLHVVSILRASKDRILNDEEDFNLSSRYNILNNKFSLFLNDNKTTFKGPSYKTIVTSGFSNQFFISSSFNAPSFGGLFKKSYKPVSNSLNVDTEDDDADADDVSTIESGSDFCLMLTNNQMSDGSWKNISSIIKQIIPKSVEDNHDLHSAIAINYLNTKCPKSYNLVAKKGTDFLISKIGKDNVKHLMTLVAKISK